MSNMKSTKALISRKTNIIAILTNSVKCARVPSLQSFLQHAFIISCHPSHSLEFFFDCASCAFNSSVIRTRNGMQTPCSKVTNTNFDAFVLFFSTKWKTFLIFLPSLVSLTLVTIVPALSTNFPFLLLYKMRCKVHTVALDCKTVSNSFMSLPSGR